MKRRIREWLCQHGYHRWVTITYRHRICARCERREMLVFPTEHTWEWVDFDANGNVPS